MKILLKLGLATGCLFSVIAKAGTCDFPGDPVGQTPVKLQKIVGGFSRPIGVKFIPGDESRYYVLEQYGKLKLVKDGQVQTPAALDITDMVNTSGNETGFLGFAFHPQFVQNRRAFVNYTTKGRPMMTHISEFKVSPNGNIDRASEKIILKVQQPYENHNGGDVHFGPDGYLYIGLGDGGSGGDPQGNGQNVKVLLGKMLRIDVDSASPYAIPTNNPDFGISGQRREIFAYGLRNPWRFSFDRVTGDLLAGDVGQNALEEIDIVVKGGNYGWKIMEGTQCYNNPSCNQTNLIKPITEYPRSEGVSVTGGYVYRGSAMPDLIGTYLYGDYGSGKIWGLRYDGTRVTSKVTLLESGISVSTFGEDHKGEIYVLDHEEGSLYKLVQNTTAQIRSVFPKTLTETGCFQTLKPLKPISGIEAYTVNSPLWSDGAHKDRFVFVPNGQKIQFSETEAFQFPEGSVLIKNFYLPSPGKQNRLLETRFLVKRGSAFKGYTYRWNGDASEAQLLAGAITSREVIATGAGTEAFDYYFPSSSDCQRCHTPSGAPLGFTAAQLNKGDPSRRGDNQILKLAARGIFDSSSVPSNLSHVALWPDPLDRSVPLDTRARSYLQTQCASCHNPANGASQGTFNLKFAVPFSQTGLCNKDPSHGNLGVADAKIVKPGDPSKSLLYLRMTSTHKSERMPPLATSRIDQEGSKVIESWIRGMTRCD